MRSPVHEESINKLCFRGRSPWNIWGDLKLKSRGKQVHVKGAPATFYSMEKHSLGQVPFCRLVEFSRFPIRLSVLGPWDMGDTWLDVANYTPFLYSRRHIVTWHWFKTLIALMYAIAVVLSDWTKMRYSVKVQQRDLRPNSKTFDSRQFIWMVCSSIPQSPPVEVFPQTALETSVVMVALADSFGWGKDVIYPPSQSFLRRRRQGHRGIKVLPAFTEGVIFFLLQVPVMRFSKFHWKQESLGLVLQDE